LSPDASPALIDLFSSPGSSRPPTTSIYNDYIDVLPLHAMMGWRACRGLNLVPIML